MTIPNDIALNEELGRGVFSKDQAKRAQRSRVPLNAFLVQEDTAEVSVDRLTLAPLDEATEIADLTANARNRNFYGWAIVTAKKACKNGRSVIATPIPNSNPYHADIVLPTFSVQNQREKQKRHAQELADASCWRKRTDAP